MLPCKGQFNTVTRDTMPFRLIGQPDDQVSEASSKGNEVSPGDELNLQSMQGENYYEMPKPQGGIPGDRKSVM